MRSSNPGLWHCKYIEPAQRLLPYCRLAHIGISPAIARKYFWDACSAFSLNYSTLLGKEGADFRADCKAAKKDLYVWTVNERPQMIQATKWGVKAILTDRTADFLSLRRQMKSEWLDVLYSHLDSRVTRVYCCRGLEVRRQRGRLVARLEQPLLLHPHQREFRFLPLSADTILSIVMMDPADYLHGLGDLPHAAVSRPDGLASSRRRRRKIASDIPPSCPCL